MRCMLKMLKWSVFNFYKETPHKNMLIYNTCTGGIYLLPKKFFRLLTGLEECLENRYFQNQIKTLKKELYIVDFDEIALLKHQFYDSAYSPNVVGITICPTLQCNLSCTYCYEDKNQNSMTETTLTNLIKFVDKYTQNSNMLSITWYGGEPLYDLNTLININNKIEKLLKTKTLNYEAHMISNCLLLDESKIELLKKMHIRSIQVTLDGYRNDHDSRRIRKNGGATFDETIEKIKLLNQNSINVSLRINVDKNNKKSIPKLIKFLYSQNIVANIYLGHIQANTNACSSNSNICLTKKEFNTFNYNFINKYSNKGYKNLSFGLPIPSKKTVFCGANRAFSFVIDANGYVYKCWNEVGQINNAICNVNRLKEVNLNNLLKYNELSPFENKKCLKCKCLPICLGGCPYNRSIGSDDCFKFSSLVNQYMLDIIKKRDL